jgi:hypothetical protein
MVYGHREQHAGTHAGKLPARLERALLAAGPHYNDSHSVRPPDSGRLARRPISHPMPHGCRI